MVDFFLESGEIPDCSLGVGVSRHLHSETEMMPRETSQETQQYQNLRIFLGLTLEIITQAHLSTSGYVIIERARDDDPKHSFLSISRTKKREHNKISNLPLTILKTTAWSSLVRVKDQGIFAHCQWYIFLAEKYANLVHLECLDHSHALTRSGVGEHSKGYQQLDCRLRNVVLCSKSRRCPYIQPPASSL